MRIAIVGLKGSGKSTIFSSLTGMTDADPHDRGGKRIATVKVPDERVDYLASIHKPKKTTYAEIVFTDQNTAAEPSGSWLSPAAASEFRAADVLAAVLRSFDNPMLAEPVDPVAEFQAIEEEFILGDLAQVEKRLERIDREKGTGREKEALLACHAHLDASKPLRTLDLSENQWDLLRGYAFLSQKNLLVIVNTSEQDPKFTPEQLATLLDEAGSTAMSLCGTMEAEIAALPPDEQAEFLSDLGVETSARNRFIKLAHDALSLISFLTGGPDECRAWSIKRGTKARDAASVIHSDIARGFIRAEVVSFEDFKAAGGSEKQARAAGRYRLEGKEYEVLDGDIINFRFNV